MYILGTGVAEDMLFYYKHVFLALTTALLISKMSLFN
jgi:hypothetical protein